MVSEPIESRAAAILAFLESRSMAAVVACIAASAGAICFVDSVGPLEVEVVPLYLLPIFVATWGIGLRAGLLTATLCAGAWLGVDYARHVYQARFHEVWNITLYFGSFVTFCFVMHTLKRVLDHEKSLATTDSLTGAPNRRAFETRMELELARCRRTPSALTLALFDGDDFKSINDLHGHAVGDEALRLVVSTVHSIIRPTDLFARLGGDEFALLLPDTSPDAAEGVVGKILLALHDRLRAADLKLTMSVGASTFLVPARSVTEMLHQVDELLYKVKSSGKGQVAHTVVLLPEDRATSRRT